MVDRQTWIALVRKLMRPMRKQQTREPVANHVTATNDCLNNTGKKFCGAVIDV